MQYSIPASQTLTLFLPSPFYDLCSNWPKRCESSGKSVIHQAIVLGLGSMFNHSVIRQNVGWKRNLEAGVIIYSTLRDIEQGEELLISYGSRLTFEDVEAAEIRAAEEEEEGDGLSILSRIDV